MVDNVKKFIEQFISLKDVKDKKIVTEIKMKDQTVLLLEVYLKMLKYMLPIDKKEMLVNAASESVLKEVQRDEAFHTYKNSFGKSALLVYLKALQLKKNKQRIETIFTALLQTEKFRSDYLKNKDTSTMKTEIDAFLSQDTFDLHDKTTEERIKKEIKSLKDNRFQTPLRTCVAALLFLRANEKPKSLPALMKNGEPFFYASEEVEDKEVAGVPKTGTLENFWKYYVAKIHSNNEYQSFVKKSDKYWYFSSKSNFSKRYINEANVETYETNILKITNSVLEWLEKKPLISNKEITDKLLNTIIEDVEKKLSKQSMHLPKKTPLLRVA